jgi:hypothetical protein
MQRLKLVISHLLCPVPKDLFQSNPTRKDINIIDPTWHGSAIDNNPTVWSVDVYPQASEALKIIRPNSLRCSDLAKASHRNASIVSSSISKKRMAEARLTCASAASRVMSRYCPEAAAQYRRNRATLLGLA